MNIIGFGSKKKEEPKKEETNKIISEAKQETEKDILEKVKLPAIIAVLVLLGYLKGKQDGANETLATTAGAIQQGYLQFTEKAKAELC